MQFAALKNSWRSLLLFCFLGRGTWQSSKRYRSRIGYALSHGLHCLLNLFTVISSIPSYEQTWTPRNRWSSRVTASRLELLFRYFERVFDRFILFSLDLSYAKSGNKNVQLVLQHCREPFWNTELHVLPPTFKPVLQQTRLLQVVWILTSDWIK